ncbi:MAG: nucleotide sugar dehydrogenase [Candidatus Adlerbacteria bacterium]|nr:nucleotide sugar dehydrogenase [Candidatus Adlerbacteria bacterium]
MEAQSATERIAGKDDKKGPKSRIDKPRNGQEDEHPPPRLLNVAVVGVGYVGLPLALLARAKGYRVRGIDIDERKRAAVRDAAVADLDASFTEALRVQPLEVSGHFGPVRSANIVIVCVPTPVDDEHNPDLSLIEGAARRVGRNLHQGALVILESTVHPGTCDEIFIPILEKASGLRAGKDFGVAHCPERINPGDKVWTIERIPRVVGATTEKALSLAASFYRSILSASVHEMESIKEAEAVKVVENSFRDINIAFVNELAMSFSKLGIDVSHVLSGAATKPFGFLLHQPGCGVGGHCIPVDPYYLIRYAKRNGFSHRFLSLARTINEGMPAYTVSLVETGLHSLGRTLSNSSVALLGLSYKANVSDLRESPSFEIKELLESKGARVRTFDEHAPDRSTTHSLAEALDGADAAIVATAHAEFAGLPPSVFASRGVRVVVDGRNCLQKEQYLRAGILYRGIGR